MRFLVWLLVLTSLALASCSSDAEEPAPSPGASITVSTSTTEVTTSSVSSTPTVTSSDSDGHPVDVYYGLADSEGCGNVQALARKLDDSVDLYRSTFVQLVAGPSESEIVAGASTFFSSKTADVINSVVVSDGLMRVDFADLRTLIPNASSSCGSQALLSQLNSTAFQFTEVERTRFSIEGSCGDFASWLQRECFETNKEGQELGLPTSEQAGGSGCTPASIDTLPAGRWFGFISDAASEELAFDLACWFTGDAAELAASEDLAESPPPNDYYIRNESDRLRTHPVDSAAEVEWLAEPGNPESVEVVTYESWLVKGLDRLSNSGFWITVTDDGHVMRIEEQFVP